jgi:ABC-2 type transport system permease protein
VSGPGALGGGVRRAWDLLVLIATTEFKRTYFGTALGYVWAVGRPLMLFGVLLVVFTVGLHLGDAVPHYPVLLLFNIVLFTFFQEGSGTAVPSIVSAEAIVRKTQFPRLVIPVSVVVTSIFNLALNLIVVFVFLLASGITPHVTWLLLPVLIAALFVLTTAMAMLLSCLYPRYRDLAIIWSVVSTALFYGTPVIYVLQRLSPTLRDIVSVNPLTIVLELGRKWIVDPSAPGPLHAVSSPALLLIPVGLSVALCVVAVWVFQREAPRIAEAL